MKNNAKPLEKLFWLDMEMTGLIPEKDRILEAGVVITDLAFKSLDAYECVVFQSPAYLEGMDDWCKKTHGESGLVAKVPSGITETQLDQDLCALADKHYGKTPIVLCGNSIGQDRKFVDLYLPQFAARLHYRMIDVSSFKEIYKHKFGIVFPKKETHRAVADIEESIAELNHYVSFIQPPAPASSVNPKAP